MTCYNVFCVVIVNGLISKRLALWTTNDIKGISEFFPFSDDHAASFLNLVDLFLNFQ